MTRAIRKMQRLAKRRHEVTTQHQEAVKEAQRTCPHSSVLQARFADGYIRDQVPRRVCQACGLIESGWTFRVLREEPAMAITQHQLDVMAWQAVYGVPEA